MGDVAEMVIQQRVQVVATEYLDAKLKMVRLESDVVRKRSFQPGQWVEFRVSDHDFRHYTPSAHNARTGLMEVLFYLHEKGPGSTWAHQIKPGDEMMMLGPAGKFVLNPKAPHHLFVGDETSIGVCKVMQDALGERANFTCLIECEKEYAHWPQLAGLAATVAIKETTPGTALLRQLGQLHIPTNTVVYLSGHAGSIQLVRKALITQGIPTGNILAKAYWADGKRGL